MNPFALEPTESNIKFVFSLVKLLLTNGRADLEPEDDDVTHKAVQDTDSSRSLINDRLAYVALSRAADDARIYTNDVATLGERLSRDVSKASAIDLGDVRQAVDSFRRDDPEAATNLLRHTHRIQVLQRSRRAGSAVAKVYVSKTDRAVIVAPDKTEREELTRLIRAELYEQGRLGETYSASVLTDKRLTDKEAKSAANYEVGDVLRYGARAATNPAQHPSVRQPD